MNSPSEVTMHPAISPELSCSLPKSPIASSIEEKRKGGSKKSVSFHHVVKFRRIPHVLDIPDEEKQHLWIDQEELRKIRQNCRELVDQMDAGNEISPELLSDRALEQFRQPQQLRRRHSRFEACKEVLTIQEFQLDLFDLFNSRGNISQLIATRYSKHCAEAQDEAQQRGLQDANEVVPRAA